MLRLKITGRRWDLYTAPHDLGDGEQARMVFVVCSGEDGFFLALHPDGRSGHAASITPGEGLVLAGLLVIGAAREAADMAAWRVERTMLRAVKKLRTRFVG
jgi:hypothetical protein